MVLAVIILVESALKWYKWLVTDKLTPEEIKASPFSSEPVEKTG